MKQQWLRLEQLAAGVHLDVGTEFLSAIPVVFSGWAFELTDEPPIETFAQVCLTNGKYTISSPFMEGPETFGDPLNTLCKLVVEAAWAQLRERRDMLCLHGAAVCINGRLVVFPSTRRAGKSTLTLGMMGTSAQVFTDDFLPLVLDKNQVLCGMAQGISPRLRLPLPEPFSSHSQAFQERHMFIQNRQYRYIAPQAGEAAPFGTLAPIGAVVFLDRSAEQPDGLMKIGPAEALQSLIRQNFSRAMNAPAILNMLAEIVENTQAYRLFYSDASSAIETILAAFGQWDSEPVRIAQHDFADAPDAGVAPVISARHSAPLIQMPGITQRIVDDQPFLSGRYDRDIIHLNNIAAGIWQLMAQPITCSEIVDTLAVAFPNESRNSIQADVNMTLDEFERGGLIGLAEQHWPMEKKSGGMPAGVVS